MCRLKNFAALLALLLFFIPLSFAGENFIDLDGDGINDNFEDIDNNRIPDRFENKASASSDSFTGFSSTGATDGINSLTKSQRYQINFNRISYLNQNRSDFDREFNTRLGGASSGGGSCAGGLCF